MMNKIFLQHCNKLIGFSLSVSLVMTNMLSTYAATPLLPSNESQFQTFELENTTIKAENSVYKNIAITEEPLKLSGSLKGKYKGFNYIIQNNTGDMRRLQFVQSEDAVKALKNIQDSRFSLRGSFWLIPGSLYTAGVLILMFPLLSQMDYTNIPNGFLNDVMHTGAFGLIVSPVTTPVGLTCLVASGASVFAILPLNIAVTPVTALASAINKHNDKLSTKQMQAYDFKQPSTALELKPNEKVEFAILTPAHMTSTSRPLLRVE